MENVFQKFDMDNSGTIDLNELYHMFRVNGIDISKDTLKCLFSIVDKDGSGGISLNEFKQFSSDPRANKVFRKIIKKLRSE